MKLHVGCGSVYLRDWLNVDLPLPHVALAKDEPGLVEEFITAEDRYYARHEGKQIADWRKGPNVIRTVCDAYGSFTFLPARSESVSEILARQVFEHLNMQQGREALKESHRVLRSCGILRLDIPDPEETLRIYRETGDEFYVRHLFGPRLSEFGFHTHYTREMLTSLAADAGFKFVQEEANPHPYPAMTLRYWKP